MLTCGAQNMSSLARSLAYFDRYDKPTLAFSSTGRARWLCSRVSGASRYLSYFFKKTRPSVWMVLFFCLWTIKKIFSVLLRMNSNSRKNHGESRVYHQFRRNCISSKRSFVYHQADKFLMHT